MENCSPINCEEKYFGRRNFFNAARNICEVAPRRILPEVLYCGGLPSIPPIDVSFMLTYMTFNDNLCLRGAVHHRLSARVLINLFMAFAIAA